MIKQVLVRFAKGAIAGAVASMAMVSFTQPSSWAGFPQILTNLGIAGVFGAMVGLMLALEKWANWTDVVS